MLGGGAPPVLATSLPDSSGIFARQRGRANRGKGTGLIVGGPETYPTLVMMAAALQPVARPSKCVRGSGPICDTCHLDSAAAVVYRPFRTKHELGRGS